METLWFNPDLYAWIPGTLVGVIGGSIGAVAGMFASAGRHRGLVFALLYAFAGFGAGLLASGGIALFDAQPAAIWAALGGPGLLALVLGLLLSTLMRKVYTESELRRMSSMDVHG